MQRRLGFSAVVVATSAVTLTALLSGCSSGDGETATPSPVPPGASAATAPDPARAEVPEVTRGATIATGLDVPWGVTFLPDGSALVAERPTGRVLRVTAGGGDPQPAGTVPGVADRGEGGLLGLAFLKGEEGGGEGTVFAYLTSTEDDNRVVRMSWDGSRLGSATPVLTGIPAGNIHNGGLLTIGPDGKLWIGTGEAGELDPAQDRDSLGGKILRLDTDGNVPSDNPFAGSPVYSLGHRNVQGLAFDSRDRPWAAEFGQNTWDELNRIVPGGNYGWPEVEGKENKEGFVEPVVQWPTSEASPSGMAIVDDVAYLGALRGRRVWQVPLDGDGAGEPIDHLNGDLGRIRNVTAVPGTDALWITTSNTDGRGTPKDGDDKVVRLDLG